MRLLRALIFRFQLAALLFVLCFAAACGHLHAAEEILSYHADIKVELSGALDVTETIRVRAEQRNIKRGIYRDYPTRYREPSRLLRTTGFKIIGIERDGEPETYHTESIQAGVRVYIGDAQTYLDTGEYTYTLHYRTTRQLRFFEKFDELYWNVTGNFWRFAINASSATVHLPEPARIAQYSAYTGRIGSTGSDATSLQEGPRRITFTTTRKLAQGEGLTIAVAWPKGVVQEPWVISTWFHRLLDNWGFVLLAFGFVAVPSYYLWAWRKFGQDPPSGTIIPLFHPPGELTPAGASYLYYRGFKYKRGVSRAFLAALVALAVNKVITIKDDDDQVTLSRGPNAGARIEGHGERELYERALGSREEFALIKSNGKSVALTLRMFANKIDNAFGHGKYFSLNIGWFVVGAILSGLILIGQIIFYVVHDASTALAIPIALVTVLGTVLLSAGIRRCRGSVPGGSVIVGTLAIIAGAIILGPLLLLMGAFSGLSAITPIVAFFFAALGVAFFYLLPAPTVRGRKLMDEVEGFRMYLSTAESERMNMVDVPEMSIELFERFLPYAVGLGVERPWSDAYAAHLTRAMPAGSSHYQPSWYSGSAWNTNAIGRSTSAFTSAVASGMASAVPSSSSGSSGSGGGGSSGGGGGGGGGGGW